MQPTTFFEFLSEGKYLPAVGIALVVIVSALRTGLGTLAPWFKTKPGGYLLGFGSAALLYFGAALEAGQYPSLAIAMSALAAGWIAAGAWEGFRDAVTALRTKPPTGGAVSLVLILAIGLGCSTSCVKDGPGSSPGPIATIIDCTVEQQDDLENLLLEFAPLLVNGEPDWDTITGKSIAAGINIGGCALATFVQNYLGGRKAVPADASWRGYRALEDFRAKHAGGAVFRTARGDL